MQKEIQEFWRWFMGHREQLSSRSVLDATIKELEDKLSSLKITDWEIGPGKKAKYMMAFSPAGNSNTLEITKEIIKSCPTELLKEWEFYPAKAPKNWDLRFFINNNNDESIEVDGKLWELIVYKFKDKTYDVVMKPPEALLKSLNSEALNWAAIIIVDGEIGEELRITRVKDIEVVKKWDSKDQTMVKVLRPGLLLNMIV
jgi:hypothetical protein